MENGLTESTLAEVCSLVTDGTHDTPKRVASGFPLIKAKEITGGRIDFENCDQISEEEHLEVIARSKPEFGDTLFAHIGASLGEAAFRRMEAALYAELASRECENGSESGSGCGSPPLGKSDPCSFTEIG